MFVTRNPDRTGSSRAASVVLTLTLSLMAVSCSSDSDSGATTDPTVTTTVDGSATSTTTVGGPAVADWSVEDPAEHGMDADKLEEARSYAFTPDRNTQGVVVVHDGAIVSEWYADDADQDSWAASWSVAKSFASALIGIAIDEGKIPGVDEPMTTWYPDWADDERSEVTLRDVLQMAPGLEWNESYDPTDMGSSDIIKLGFSEPDQLAYAISRPPSGNEPGTFFLYSSGTAMLLSGVLEQATGMSADEYAQSVLFDPIGMEKVEWWQDAVGNTLTYCCVDTPSRGFARFGQLYLNEGQWGDEQVVPESWVADSVTGSPAAPEAYGYQWWLDDYEGVPDDTFAAIGHDGQYIYVIPSLDLVVVRNGTYAKFDGPPIAEPSLYGKYPPDDLVPGKGTKPPDEWDDSSFLAPIVDSLGG